MAFLTSRRPSDRELIARLQDHLSPLPGLSSDYDGLMDAIGTARYVLLGEASHGTHDFYRERATVTQRLIVEKGFRAIALEADWPDASRVDRYVRGVEGDVDAASALGGFQRFPAWMWRNTVVRDFVEWLRQHNEALPPRRRVGVYGMDLYSLFTSIQAVLSHLDRVDPAAAERARHRYACFDHAREDGQVDGHAARHGMSPGCEDEVIQQLREMNQRFGETSAQPEGDRDQAFYAQQNARLVRNAEEYYRTLFQGRVSSWNLRDHHMVETLWALERYLGESSADGEAPRIVVWAHNSHLGDASATEMGDQGEWSVGQLVRDRCGDEAILVGFSTHRGSVTAASQWDESPVRKRVREGLEGSWEDVLHRTGADRFLLRLRGNAPLREAVSPRRLQRAIGVIYRPETERQSHYFHTRLDMQFDVLIHLDETRALEPLDADGGWHSTLEAAPSYPSGV